MFGSFAFFDDLLLRLGPVSVLTFWKGVSRRFAPRGAGAWAALSRSGLLPACKRWRSRRASCWLTLTSFTTRWALPGPDLAPIRTLNPQPSPSASRQFVNITPGTEGKPPSARLSLGPMTLSLYDFVLILQRTKLSLGTGWKSTRFPPERLSA